MGFFSFSTLISPMYLHLLDKIASLKIPINFLFFRLQDLLKKLKTTKNFSETLVLDPDLIDLTMIPPPMTPDEV